MSCVRPKKLLNPRYKGLDAESLHRLSERLYGVGFPPNYWITVPCGNCALCQKTKFRAYRMRLIYELNKYPKSVFVTLTFDNVSLSQFKDNPNKSLLLFLDRVRKKYGSQVRHWFVAEYGKKHGRLHYHGILFDIDISNDELFSLWKYGNTFVGYANEITAKYIVKYLTKEDTKGTKPPRVLSSKGIGLSWLNTPEAKLAYKSLSSTFDCNGFKIPIPRFYMSKLFTKREMELISYYYYMETPEPTEWYVAGTRYLSKSSADKARNVLLKRYNAQGLLFDDYEKRQFISSDTRFRLSLESYSKFNNFNF